MNDGAFPLGRDFSGSAVLGFFVSLRFPRTAGGYVRPIGLSALRRAYERKRDMADRCHKVVSFLLLFPL